LIPIFSLDIITDDTLLTMQIMDSIRAEGNFSYPAELEAVKN